MAKVGINIGSNLGDRKENLRYAIREIERRFECKALRSSVYETKSWGYLSDNPFFNIGIEIDVDDDYEQMLAVFKDIEQGIGCKTHRDTNGEYIDRLLDIDIIYIDNEVLDTENLKVPHPRMQDRDFVLLPVAELAPTWVHPLLHLTAAEMLSDLRKTAEILIIKTNL